MITQEQLREVNAKLPTTDIKGKAYIMVKDRVNAFRELCPNGSIVTDIISHGEGEIVMKATVKDGDTVLATGTAWEKETNSFINKTSYVENCETSAIGRALGFAGFGIDDSMASADEVANAIINQNKPKEPKINSTLVKSIKEACKKGGVKEKNICYKYEVDKLEDITFKDWEKPGTEGKPGLKEWVDETLGKAD